jgi:hypothetical protein
MHATTETRPNSSVSTVFGPELDNSAAEVPFLATDEVSLFRSVHTDSTAQRVSYTMDVERSSPREQSGHGVKLYLQFPIRFYFMLYTKNELTNSIH